MKPQIPVRILTVCGSMILLTSLASAQMIQANIGASVGPQNTYNYQNPGSAYVSPYSTYPSQGISSAAYGNSYQQQTSTRGSSTQAYTERRGRGNYIRSNYYRGRGYGGGNYHNYGYSNSGYRNNLPGTATYSPSYPGGYYNNYGYSTGYGY